ncbi:membrane protease YdiL (CAAX protease family) [Duganella sp. 1411]|uniref:CPBP family intramembrane glutamic endopeptidase n=1 Tax=Duganella sp. 1411 TaxID=2806572 RepID=UPI001AE87826|nr:type II CAAX endopeptidase family protein [Duganella sp. 1411]MBP1204895.1 membrane protease YdiL (CAAX protease family) [Duganella sp. 1411]
MISDITLATYILLAAAICAAWAKPISLGRAAIQPWLAFFVAALAFGMAAGVLRAPAIVALAALAGSAYLTARAPQRYVRVVCGVVTAVLALALAVHKLPGFNNAIVIDAVTLSPGAPPFTQYANFDKGAVGLILLALLCSRARSWNEFGGVLKQVLPVLLATLVAVLGLAVAMGAVRPDVKLSQLTMQFIAVNLFFTVVAEEAFFRGFLQHRLAAALARRPSGQWIAMACSALLFGAVHLPGGAAYALLATVAGVGYAYAYHLTRRIEAPILLHIALNAIHFAAFSYPALR